MVALKPAPEPPRRERAARLASDGAVRAQLAELQRSRLLSAAFNVVAERGAANTSVAHIVECSGVSRRTFYELFEDREECFLAAFEQAFALAARRVLPAYMAQRGWRVRIRAGLEALLCFLDEEPLVGKLLIAESLSAGRGTLARRGEVVAQITRAIDAGRTEVKGRRPDQLTAEGVVGGVLSVIHARVGHPERERLSELAGPLMNMIVLPYLGPAVAARELERPAPISAAKPSDERRPLADPFKEAGMRLTYRTVRVLTAIADEPGASNRAIGRGAGIADQGQISKLLGRLERIQLVVNTGLGPRTGAPNAWALTDKGRHVVQAIRPTTEGTDQRAGS